MGASSASSSPEEEEEEEGWTRRTRGSAQAAQVGGSGVVMIVDRSVEVRSLGVRRLEEGLVSALHFFFIWLAGIPAAVRHAGRASVKVCLALGRFPPAAKVASAGRVIASARRPWFW